MVITIDVANFLVHKELVDSGSSADIIFLHVLRKMKLDLTILQPMRMPLVGFGGSKITTLGTVDLPTLIGNNTGRKN